MAGAGNCPACGASGNLCRARFEELLAKEFEDPEYGQVHHLTVPAYMLQHSTQLTREGWIYEREPLRDFLVGGRRPEEIRLERRAALDGGRRKFKIKSRDGQPLFPPRHWSKTIVDVRPEVAAQYRKDIEAWARAVLADSEGVRFDRGK